MSSQITVTGKQNAGNTVTAKVFTQVRSVAFDCINGILHVTRQDDTVEDFDISAGSTVTCTLSTGNFTFVVS